MDQLHWKQNVMKSVDAVINRARLLGCVFVLLSIVGCSTFRMQEVYTSLEAGNPGAAFTLMEEKGPKNPKLPFLFERGLVAHYADRLQASNAALSRAADISEDLYTRSVSKEALSLLTNDLLRPYPGTRFERLLCHYYQALNYAYLEHLDGALVECRKATNLINYYKGEDENYDFFAAPFLAYLSGIFYEASGEWNDAFISYRQAETYYRNAAKQTGVKVPSDVGTSLVRMARKLGFTEEAERYHSQYGESQPTSADAGELVLFYETGYVPPKYEKTLTFPILKIDTENFDAFLEDNIENETTAESFVNHLLKFQGRAYKKVELEYLLHVAMPAIASKRPQRAGITVQIGTHQQHGILIADIEKMAIETFNRQRPTILFRTVTRAVLKYLAYRVAKAKIEKDAEEKKKELESEAEKNKVDAETRLYTSLAKLTSAVYTLATEHADTRSWKTLPNRIFIVRIPLPEGTHDVTLSFLDANGGNKGTRTLENVEIRADRITFLNHRTYD